MGPFVPSFIRPAVLSGILMSVDSVRFFRRVGHGVGQGPFISSRGFQYILTDCTTHNLVRGQGDIRLQTCFNLLVYDPAFLPKNILSAHHGRNLCLSPAPHVEARLLTPLEQVPAFPTQGADI